MAKYANIVLFDILYGYFSFFREVVNEEKKEIFNSIRLLESYIFNKVGKNL